MGIRHSLVQVSEARVPSFHPVLDIVGDHLYNVDRVGLGILAHLLLFDLPGDYLR